VKACAAIALLLMLCGCATHAPSPPRIVTHEVKVPVPVARVPPPALKSCGRDAPGFRFSATTDPTVRTGLTPEAEAALRTWVDAKERCLRAWRAWGAQ
jgi:hypothetical protein